ncbi:MAG: [protein-PII] uridylyltransferase [Sinobacteraceae bacterium]|nr:[protein-PII] uridylyltransferase [Nevskiaceae bacterium]
MPESSQSHHAPAEALIFPLRELHSRIGKAEGQLRIEHFRDVLEWGQQRLYALFHEGASAATLVNAHAQFIDTVLTAVWQALIPVSEKALALMAVGGYGRHELLPHSDVDLLFLTDGDVSAACHDALTRFNTFLWDIGLEVGSSTRSIAECVQFATDDVTVITNLLEARLLCGDKKLAATLEAAIAPEHLWPVEVFYRTKLAEQVARHHKYDDTGYKLEPNVKESPGGLRDIHMIGWVVKRQFNASSLSDLRDRGFLTEAEYNELRAGQDFLWRVRFALHMLTERHEDRLLFDYQTRVAALFGYRDDTGGNRAVEQFMQLYYRTIKSLSCLNDLLLQLFDEAILEHNANVQRVPLNERFEIRGDTIQAANEEVFKRDPVALLEIFALMQATPSVAGIRARTLRWARRDLPRLDDSVRHDPRARAIFIGLFRTGNGLSHALRRMNRYGVLGQYLPEFGRIVGLMQYDLFHTLTVDEHSLQLVRNLRRMADPRYAEELPLHSEIFKRLDRPDLIYIAGFLHDLAKGSGGDHSRLGAENALRFCADHGLPKADGKRVAWLVRNHLLMSLTAQRKDISDPEVITEFASQVGSLQRLDDLYLLTAADIRATNPTLWNAWRDSLLKELYHVTSRALERGLDNPVSDTQRVAEQRRAVLALQAADGADPAPIETLWPRFGDDYYVRHTPRELLWQLRAIAQADEADLPLILIDTLEDRGTSVFIYMRDRDHLFTLTAGVLARLGLSILDARISTSADGYTLDTWMVLDPAGPGAADAERRAEIHDALHTVLANTATTTVPVNRRISRRLRHFNTPPQVRTEQDPVRDCTVLELTAGDRPGLLAEVGRALGRRHLRIEAAKISTIGERAEDVFFITDVNHQPIADTRLLKNLRRALMRSLRQNATLSKNSAKT